MVKSMVLRELHTLEETTMDKVRFLMSDTGAQITAACREALEQKGVEVTVVEKDGNKVLQKMLSVRPQVVLLDAFMPGLDALAVKQRYNAAGERHTSFFVTGAFQSEEMVQELLDEGFAYYFVKPFDENVLASRVLKVALGQEKRVLHTSVGSDGTDGPTDAAGGYVDGDTAAALAAAGRNVFDTLQNNDAYHALQAVDGLIITGATGTNVNDVAVVLIGGEEQADA